MGCWKMRINEIYAKGGWKATDARPVRLATAADMMMAMRMK